MAAVDILSDLPMGPNFETESEAVCLCFGGLEVKKGL